MTDVDWNPAAYAAFGDLRLRPALDLLAQVGDVPAGDIVDLGCGNGAVAGALRARFPDRRLIGVDSSPAMLEKAKGYDALVEVDAALWESEAPPALIFSNALLHWVPEHDIQFPRLALLLASGGVLAVQMPDQFDAPSHRLLREIAADLIPDRFDRAFRAPVAPLDSYYRLLRSFGAVSIWETTYLQELVSSGEGHPVRHFTQSTAMRPYATRMSDQERATYIAQYDAALAESYPPGPDGSVLLPFRRVFVTLRKQP
ncbi:methyltransferase domain-containing protein [Pelagovum pacificum]|uniref:Methyltransferase domain-containing protein n=1 Tax=Pelagovum pacificum TaxID=2588711 RepID=A0A5C5GBH0_9RHOB|nr:methyltransferase domain-containing protein [Pelagovum pacificum]QQA41658.1 methyltransferase domain-containing protein [Pelagovum pacificum]TNY30937.1 methyltransferase domain-containing protein [Pelagovum pacificum]